MTPGRPERFECVVANQAGDEAKGQLDQERSTAIGPCADLAPEDGIRSNATHRSGGGLGQGESFILMQHFRPRGQHGPGRGLYPHRPLLPAFHAA